MAKQSVRDDGDLQKYYAAIPNIVFDLGLNPYELALYGHFKRAAGNKKVGVCWKSRATIARESGMSSGMVTKARQALEMPRAELGGKPLITVTEEPSKTGGKPTCRVAMSDIWLENMSKFSTSPYDIATSHDDVEPEAPSHGAEQRHHTTIATSPHDPKEQSVKKNQEERKEEPQHAVRADQRGARLPDDFCLNSSMREWASLNTPNVDLEVSLAEFCDYWRGIPGQRGKKLDWPATWRNRMRELEGRARRNGNGNGTSQPRTNQTAAERRNAEVIRIKQRAAELRSRGDERAESILRGEPSASGR